MKKQSFYFLGLLTVAAGLVFTSCKNNVDYKKTKSGIMYKIFSSTKDSVVKQGNIMKINFTIKIGSTDSVLQTSVGKSPLFFTHRRQCTRRCLFSTGSIQHVAQWRQRCNRTIGRYIIEEKPGRTDASFL